MPFGKPHGHDAAFDFAETKKPLFILAVIQILNNYAMGIGEGILGIKKGHPMLFLISLIFQNVPFKSWCHMANVIRTMDIVKKFRLTSDFTDFGLEPI